MRDTLPKVSEEDAVTVGQVTPFHSHNSVNFHRHLLHSIIHLLLFGVG